MKLVDSRMTVEWNIDVADIVKGCHPLSLSTSGLASAIQDQRTRHFRTFPGRELGDVAEGWDHHCEKLAGYLEAEIDSIGTEFDLYRHH